MWSEISKKKHTYKDILWFNEWERALSFKDKICRIFNILFTKADFKIVEGD